MNPIKKLFEKIRGKRKGPPPESVPIPSSWPKKRPGEETDSSQKYVLIPTEKKSYKIHVPGLRTTKRLTATILLFFNFFISQVTLTGPATTRPFAIFFLLNAFLLADYLWKTRAKPKVEA